MHDGHSHGGHGQPAAGRDEAVALLTYMLSHNRHHADELHDAAHALPEGDAAAREAVLVFNERTMLTAERTVEYVI